jgi:hypothetical protein
MRPVRAGHAALRRHGQRRAQLTGSGSALHSAATAIMCADAPVPRSPSFYWKVIEANRASAPLFSPVDQTISPCAFWPYRPPRPMRIANHVPALVVSASGDINAILPIARAMHRALAGSRMITLQGVRTHGVYLFEGSACVDDAVNCSASGTAATTSNSRSDNSRVNPSLRRTESSAITMRMAAPQ